ncbi:hypothetical protein EVAR_88748_1 [Eumeta japonica]|uniref:Uncharacterized protein n=1 Tax=Eumeta variegata TaxID=151549 RepID=A0A4C1XV07_EUMVA|nr:hypothetical protein EVAR_88748_1 [Eumeta japonica]
MRTGLPLKIKDQERIQPSSRGIHARGSAGTGSASPCIRPGLREVVLRYTMNTGLLIRYFRYTRRARPKLTLSISKSDPYIHTRTQRTASRVSTRRIGTGWPVTTRCRLRPRQPQEIDSLRGNRVFIWPTRGARRRAAPQPAAAEKKPQATTRRANGVCAATETLVVYSTNSKPEENATGRTQLSRKRRVRAGGAHARERSLVAIRWARTRHPREPRPPAARRRNAVTRATSTFVRIDPHNEPSPRYAVGSAHALPPRRGRAALPPAFGPRCPARPAPARAPRPRVLPPSHTVRIKSTVYKKRMINKMH